MKDIFDAKIICEKCNVQMKQIQIAKNGFLLRAVQCASCGDKIIHPNDLKKYEQYSNLKGKVFKVKLRIVGNSHAITIPNEIISFINESDVMRRKMDEMVKLCFEDFGRLSLILVEDKKRSKNGFKNNKW